MKKYLFCASLICLSLTSYYLFSSAKADENKVNFYIQQLGGAVLMGKETDAINIRMNLIDENAYVSKIDKKDNCVNIYYNYKGTRHNETFCDAPSESFSKNIPYKAPANYSSNPSNTGEKRIVALAKDLADAALNLNQTEMTRLSKALLKENVIVKNIPIEKEGSHYCAIVNYKYQGKDNSVKKCR